MEKKDSEEKINIVEWAQHQIIKRKVDKLMKRYRKADKLKEIVIKQYGEWED